MADVCNRQGVSHVHSSVYLAKLIASELLFVSSFRPTIYFLDLYINLEHIHISKARTLIYVFHKYVHLRNVIQDPYQLCGSFRNICHHQHKSPLKTLYGQARSVLSSLGLVLLCEETKNKACSSGALTIHITFCFWAYRR